MSTVIKVENLSKQYRLGQVGTGTISHDVNRWWHKIRGKEDPYLKIGESNDRTVKGDSDYVWALKDINFEVKQGEVLGIIGRNGAGKSTLLKILSRTTAPTTGSVKIKGRVASLLEVGTGFHPELSGRDNIFLNGAILGMTGREIQSKFDEIVDFAGVERYIDTPVKRYSSGMYVRLAFAVAAHLEPEILIVDEVLAVGDAEFQKKCLGKMKDVSVNHGRTVLFVSHNLAAIQTLADCGIFLEQGISKKYSNVSELLNVYRTSQSLSHLSFIEIEVHDSNVKIEQVKINTSIFNRVELKNNQEISIFIKGQLFVDLSLNIELRIFDLNDYPIAIYSPGHYYGETKKIKAGQFVFEKRIRFPENINKGEYKIEIYLTDPGKKIYAISKGSIIISVEGVYCKTGFQFENTKAGIFLLKDI